MNLYSTVCVGGMNIRPQISGLRRKNHFIIGTPGRVKDHIERGTLKLNDVKTIVLDEVDRMLDMGFINDVKKIVAKLPAKKQTLFFSATMPPEIEKLSATLLHNPAKVEVTPVSSTVEKIEQAVYFVEKENKKHLLNELFYFWIV